MLGNGSGHTTQGAKSRLWVYLERPEPASAVMPPLMSNFLKIRVGLGREGRWRLARVNTGCASVREVATCTCSR